MYEPGVSVKTQQQVGVSHPRWRYQLNPLSICPAHNFDSSSNQFSAAVTKKRKKRNRWALHGTPRYGSLAGSWVKAGWTCYSLPTEDSPNKSEHVLCQQNGSIKPRNSGSETKRCCTSKLRPVPMITLACAESCGMAASETCSWKWLLLPV